MTMTSPSNGEHPHPGHKRLIVNGDDFGLSEQVNAAILHAHWHGILTNASLMVSARAWRGAVELARATPSLQVGLHLTLVQGRAVLDHRHIPQLTDRDGHFLHNPIRAGLRYFFSSRVRSQIRDECRAQIERFLATGLPLAHIDGHVNIHLHPIVLNSLLELAEEYGIRAMRLTREDLACSLALDPRAALRKRLESGVFTRLARYAEHKLAATGIVWPDALFGLHQTGRVDEPYLLKLLPRLQADVTELYCHPAFLPCPEVQRWTPDYRRDAELAALTSQAVRRVLEDQHIELIGYRELYQQRKPALLSTS